jgi:hypothetical protein
MNYDYLLDHRIWAMMVPTHFFLRWPFIGISYFMKDPIGLDISLVFEENPEMVTDKPMFRISPIMLSCSRVSAAEGGVEKPVLLDAS